MSCIKTLKEKGLKLTPQRRLIVDAIHDIDAQLTAEEIIAHVQSRMPEVHKSTIYRTLELLEKNGCVFKSEFGERSVYHHVDEGHHHHHLVCRSCGRTVECDETIFQPLEKSLLEKHGFYADFRHLAVGGLCKECLKKNR